MTSTIIRSTGTITDTTRPRIERDPAIYGEECVWMFDFTDPSCNPSSELAPANGLEFVNLARAASGLDYGISAVLRNAGDTISQEVGRGGLTFPAGTFSVTDYVEIGESWADFGQGDDDYLVTVWDNQPLVGYNATSFQPILWCSQSNANFASMWLDSGANGVRPRGVIGDGTTNSGVESTPVGIGQGAVRQLAFARQGTLLSFFVNGALVATNTTAITTLYSLVTNPTKLAANHIGTIYRTGGFRLGGSNDRPIAEIVAADYAAKPYLLR